MPAPKATIRAISPAEAGEQVARGLKQLATLRADVRRAKEAVKRARRALKAAKAKHHKLRKEAKALKQSIAAASEIASRARDLHIPVMRSLAAKAAAEPKPAKTRPRTK